MESPSHRSKVYLELAGLILEEIDASPQSSSVSPNLHHSTNIKSPTSPSSSLEPTPVLLSAVAWAAHHYHQAPLQPSLPERQRVLSSSSPLSSSSSTSSSPPVEQSRSSKKNKKKSNNEHLARLLARLSFFSSIMSVQTTFLLSGSAELTPSPSPPPDSLAPPRVTSPDTGRRARSRSPSNLSPSLATQSPVHRRGSARRLPHSRAGRNQTPREALPGIVVSLLKAIPVSDIVRTMFVDFSSWIGRNLVPTTSPGLGRLIAGGSEAALWTELQSLPLTLPSEPALQVFSHALRTTSTRSAAYSSMVALIKAALDNATLTAIAKEHKVTQALSVLASFMHDYPLSPVLAHHLIAQLRESRERQTYSTLIWPSLEASRPPPCLSMPEPEPPSKPLPQSLLQLVKDFETSILRNIRSWCDPPHPINGSLTKKPPLPVPPFRLYAPRSSNLLVKTLHPDAASGPKGHSSSSQPGDRNSNNTGGPQASDVLPISRQSHDPTMSTRVDSSLAPIDDQVWDQHNIGHSSSSSSKLTGPDGAALPTLGIVDEIWVQVDPIVNRILTRDSHQKDPSSPQGSSLNAHGSNNNTSLSQGHSNTLTVQHNATTATLSPPSSPKHSRSNSLSEMEQRASYEHIPRPDGSQPSFDPHGGDDGQELVLTSKVAGTFSINSRSLYWTPGEGYWDTIPGDSTNTALPRSPSTDGLPSSDHRPHFSAPTGITILLDDVSQWTYGLLPLTHFSHPSRANINQSSLQVQAYYLSFHTSEVYRFFPLYDTELQDAVTLITRLTGLEPFSEEEYVQSVLEEALEVRRVDIFNDLVNSQVQWISYTSTLNEVLRRLLSLESELSGDALLYQLEYLYHSCRLNDEVAREAFLQLFKAGGSATAESAKLRVLAVMDRLLDRAILPSGSPLAQAVAVWTEREQTRLDSYRNADSLQMLSALHVRATNLHRHGLSTMTESQTHDVFDFLPELRSYQKRFRI